MKCAICNRKTTWEDSIGRPSYLVCNSCVDKIAKHENKSFTAITMEILQNRKKMVKSA